VIHRTFRSLDDAPKLVGFTLRQWGTLIAGSSGVLGLIYLTRLPTKPAITLFVFVIGLPAALTYVSESGGLALGALLRDMCRWRCSRHTLAAASTTCHCRHGVMVLAPREATTPARPLRERHVGAEDMGLWERWDS
jgi:hypothetical protein